MKHLPATIEDLAGRRAARWIRESTAGQFDRYGPEAQTEMQDRAIARLALTDSGLAWRAAHSGRTVYRSAEMVDMLGAAQRGEFDVLLVGYVSRWQSNVRRTLELLEDTLHTAGVPVSSATRRSSRRRSATGTSWSMRPRTPSATVVACLAGSRRVTRPNWRRSVTLAAVRRSASGATRPSCLSPTPSAS